MHGSLQTKLKRLTPAQMACIEGHGKHWAQIRTSTAPANREEAERGIATAYRAAGWPAPEQIVWCESPMQMAALWAKTPHDRSGPNLRAAIADQVRSRAAFAIQRRVSGSLLATVDELSSSPAGEETVGDTVREAALRASQAVRPASPYKRRWLFWLGRRRPWLQLQDAGYAPRTHAWLERQDFFRFACELTGETEPLAGLLLIATHADWIVPHRHICWVSEPPQLLKTDERGRLHSASGPGAPVPRRLGHLRLEGGGGARTRDRAARANHARGYRAGRGHPRPPLHDRADDAGAVHRRRGGFPDSRRTKPESSGRSAGRMATPGLPSRLSTARQSRTACASTTSCRCRPTC